MTSTLPSIINQPNFSPSADGQSGADGQPGADGPTVVNIGDSGIVPEGYRSTSYGNLIPQSMHSSSQSARKVYFVCNGAGNDPSNESSNDSQAVPCTEADESDVVCERKKARLDRREVRAKASCEGCCFNPPFGHPSQHHHMSFGGCMDPDRPEQESDVSSNMSNDDDDDDDDDDDTFTSQRPSCQPPPPPPSPKKRGIFHGDDDPPSKRSNILVNETPPSTPIQIAPFAPTNRTIPETDDDDDYDNGDGERLRAYVARPLRILIGRHVHASRLVIRALIMYATDNLGGDPHTLKSVIDEAFDSVHMPSYLKSVIDDALDSQSRTVAHYTPDKYP